MSFLLDTHILVWWLEDLRRLPQHVSSILQDESVRIFVSIATAWELEIKRALGKIETPDDLPQVIDENNFSVLPVEFEHIASLRTLPLLHRDPFDRMLLAQALAEGLTLITHDPALKRYNVPILLA